jgi:selenide,water dikinase
MPGDRLLLTKPLGTGVISTAIKKGVAKQEWIEAAVRSMTTLNKAAAEVIRAFVETHASKNAKVGVFGLPADDRRPTTDDGPANSQQPTTSKGSSVHALTDITGFGLIGHVREMLLASENVSAQIRAEDVPLLNGAVDCVRAGHIPGGLKANRDFAECAVDYDAVIPEELKTILFDPQTAGGLLISVAAEESHDLMQKLQDAGVPATEIGEIFSRTGPLIVVK